MRSNLLGAAFFSSLSRSGAISLEVFLTMLTYAVFLGLGAKASESPTFFVAFFKTGSFSAFGF